MEKEEIVIIDIFKYQKLNTVFLFFEYLLYIVDENNLN